MDRLSPSEGVHARIGRYLLGDELGRGGMGTVYRAYDPALSRWVALKLPAVTAAAARGLWASRSRLLREAQALASVQHPGIVEIYDVGLGDHQTYLTMRLIRGRTLRQRPDLNASPGGNAGGFLRVIRDVGTALAAVHAAGIVHRDVKPDNLMIGDDGHVTLIDFGLARAWHRQRDACPDIDSTVLDLALSSASDRAGTPRYMAPELRADAAPHPAADQYSLCMILLERGERLLMRGGPALARVVRRGLAEDPARRFPDMQAFLDELWAALCDLRWLGSREVGPPQRATTHA